MKKLTRSSLCAASLLSVNSFLQAQPCYLTRIIEADGDTISIAYDGNNHITSIAKKSIVKTNSNGLIMEIIHDSTTAASFSRATFKYDNNNNLIQYEQFESNPNPAFIMKYSYNSSNQLIGTQSAVAVDQNYFYGYRVFTYPNTTTKNPSTIKNYPGDAHGKIGNPDETITLTYDDKKATGYLLPLDDYNPFATNNITHAVVTEVGRKPKTEIFTYEYNSFGYPISKTEKEGERTYVTTYSYDCK